MCKSINALFVVNLKDRFRYSLHYLLRVFFYKSQQEKTIMLPSHHSSILFKHNEISNIATSGKAPACCQIKKCNDLKQPFTSVN